MKTRYEQCLEAMYGLRRFGIILGLDVTRGILKELGDPHLQFKAVHVAGTNGKGSVASALSSILMAAGYKTGLYTSPHLVRFNERICIDNQPISDDAVVEIHGAVQQGVKNITAQPNCEREPTFFEYNTAMAFYEFARQKVDWAVIETGMGGRMDSTNVLKPAVSVITNISLEHKMYLGNTIAAIAGEKGGIIKEGIPVVTGVRQKSAFNVIEKLAKERNAPLYAYGREFTVRRNKKKKTFDYQGFSRSWQDLSTALAGSFQIDNAALSLAVCEALMNQGVKIPETAVQTGLAANQWPGRLEMVSETPLVLLDGAHNLAAARRLGEYLAAELEHRHITLITGILDDKPYAEIFRHLLPQVSRVIVTAANTERALKPEILAEAARIHSDDVTVIPDVEKAVMQTIEKANPDDVILIAGSLYVVGEAKAALEKKGLPAFKLACEFNII